MLALFHHDINAPRWAFYRVTCNLLGFKQVINNDGAVREPAGFITLKRFVVRINMVDSPFSGIGGTLGSDQHALNVSPFAEFFRK